MSSSNSKLSASKNKKTKKASASQRSQEPSDSDEAFVVKKGPAATEKSKAKAKKKTPKTKGAGSGSGASKTAAAAAKPVPAKSEKKKKRATPKKASHEETNNEEEEDEDDADSDLGQAFPRVSVVKADDEDAQGDEVDPLWYYRADYIEIPKGKAGHVPIYELTILAPAVPIPGFRPNLIEPDGDGRKDNALNHFKKELVRLFGTDEEKRGKKRTPDMARLMKDVRERYHGICRADKSEGPLPYIYADPGECDGHLVPIEVPPKLRCHLAPSDTPKGMVKDFELRGGVSLDDFQALGYTVPRLRPRLLKSKEAAALRVRLGMGGPDAIDVAGVKVHPLYGVKFYPPGHPASGLSYALDEDEESFAEYDFPMRSPSDVITKLRRMDANRAATAGKRTRSGSLVKGRASRSGDSEDAANEASMGDSVEEDSVGGGEDAAAAEDVQPGTEYVTAVETFATALRYSAVEKSDFYSAVIRAAKNVHEHVLDMRPNPGLSSVAGYEDIYETDAAPVLAVLDSFPRHRPPEPVVVLLPFMVRDRPVPPLPTKRKEAAAAARPTKPVPAQAPAPPQPAKKSQQQQQHDVMELEDEEEEEEGMTEVVVAETRREQLPPPAPVPLPEKPKKAAPRPAPPESRLLNGVVREMPIFRLIEQLRNKIYELEAWDDRGSFRAADIIACVRRMVEHLMSLHEIASRPPSSSTEDPLLAAPRPEVERSTLFFETVADIAQEGLSPPSDEDKSEQATMMRNLFTAWSDGSGVDDSCKVVAATIFHILSTPPNWFVSEHRVRALREKLARLEAEHAERRAAAAAAERAKRAAAAAAAAATASAATVKKRPAMGFMAMLGKGGAKPAAAAAAATTTTTTTTAEPMETEEVGDVPEPPELLLVRKALDIALQPGATEMLGVVEMPIRLAYANAVHEEAVTQAVADPVHLSVSANDRKHVCPQAHTYEHGEDRPCNGSMMLARATAAVCCILDTEGMAGQWDAFYRELGLDRIGSIRELIEGPKGEMGEATSASGDRVWLMHLAVLLGVMDVILPHAPGLERFERVEKVHAFLSASWSAFEAATDLIAASRAACGAIFGDL